MASSRQESPTGPVAEGSTRPQLSTIGPGSGYHSPLRQHQRTSSATRIVKETYNAQSYHSNSEDDGASQIRINQYLIMQEIGRGSFGAVHLAIDQYGKEFAVKEFSKSRLRRRAQSNLLRRSQQQSGLIRENSSGPMGLRSPLARRPKSPLEDIDNCFDLIKEELAVMKKLNHPNVVSLVEVLDDPDEDSLYMVLEMCKKGVIMKIEVDEPADPYDEEDCRCWFRDLILGIEYLHGQGVVHRDIKPDNCLLTEDDTLKIVDFGVSEIFEKHSDMKIAKSAGSPAFMAPELCIVQPGYVSGRPADIWSMGVTLYCLRFGRVPFQKTSVLELYSSIINDDFQMGEDCGPAFRDLMTRILEKHPNKRIKMEELREHAWVTRQGTDPLLSAEENCAEIIAPPTEAEKDAAITNNMSGLVAVMKAVNRFKSLVERRSPGSIEGIFGRASRIVKPPLAMARGIPHLQSNLAKPQNPDSARERDLHIGDDQVFKETHREEHLSGQVSPAACSSNNGHSPHAQIRGPHADAHVRAQEDRNQAPKQNEFHTERAGQIDTGKGHAHDPLKDHLYLDIGLGPASQDPTSATFPIVSESPVATDHDVYEEAYKDEVAKIRSIKGMETTVYLNRRVESSKSRKDTNTTLGTEGNDAQQASRPSLKGLFGKVMSSTTPSRTRDTSDNG